MLTPCSKSTHVKLFHEKIDTKKLQGMVLQNTQDTEAQGEVDTISIQDMTYTCYTAKDTVVKEGPGQDSVGRERY